MHLVTVVNKDHPGLELWVHTARLAGHEPTVLRAPKSSKIGHESKWFGQKFVTLDAHLSTLPPDDLVIVTDGFDVVVLDAPGVIESKLRSSILPSQLLFSAEVFENPDQGNPYKTHHLRFPFLNSGTYGGSVAAIREALKPALDDPNVLQLDDQRYFTQQMFARPDRFVLDHDARLFVCLAGFKDFSFSNGRLVVNFSKATPSVLHFQGYFKNTRGVLPHLFPSDRNVARWASLLHRQPNALTPLGDALSAIGKPLPFGDKAPFLVGLLVVICVVGAALWDWKRRRG
jgi:hypothetical protein